MASVSRADVAAQMTSSVMDVAVSPVLGTRAAPASSGADPAATSVSAAAQVVKGLLAVALVVNLVV